jgi:hypothetical protein
MTPSDVSAHEEAVIELLRKSGPSSFDNLIRYVPHLSWGEVFVAVDQMSGDGRLLIRRGSADSIALSDHTLFAACITSFAISPRGGATMTSLAARLCIGLGQAA